MKAVIMAGGRGKRLSPLTDRKPKPLLPVGGTPAIRLILRTLLKNGITEAAVTVGYLADELEKSLGNEAEGVRLTYFREEKPLGTAGGVAAAAEFIGSDDFAVLSGDAVCDFDLLSAYREWKKSGADGAIILKKVKNPGEYGVTLCGDGGMITGFSEKPSLSSTYSDTVNTGVYLFSADIFGLIPRETEYDFGRDLFPKMISEGMKLLGTADGGYWCDIGSPESYLAANMYATGGKNSVGHGTRIAEGCDISSSVVMDGVTVEEGVFARNAVISDGCRIGKNTNLGRGCVIGEDCVIGSGVTFSDGVRLPAGSEVSDGETLRNGFCFESMEKASELLDIDGLLCKKRDMTVAYVTKLGSSLCTASGNGRIGILCDGSETAQSCSVALTRGIRVGGGEAVLLGTGFPAAASWAAFALGLDCTVFVKDEEEYMRLYLFDKNGLYPKRDFERKLLSVLSSETEIGRERPEVTARCNFAKSSYLPMLTENRRELDGFTVRVTSDNLPSKFLCRALIGLGAGFGDGGLTLSLGEDGFSLTAVQDGYSLDFTHIKALILKYLVRGKAALPVSSPTVLFDIGGSRCRGYSHCPSGDYEDSVRAEASETPELFHACAAAVELCGLVFASGRSLKELCVHIPTFSTECEEMASQNGLSVISSLGTPDGDGVRAERSRGSVRVTATKRGLLISTEAASGEYARELMSLSKKEILRLLSEN